MNVHFAGQPTDGSDAIGCSAPLGATGGDPTDGSRVKVTRPSIRLATHCRGIALRPNVERLTEDLAAVTHGWRHIAQTAPPTIAKAAELAILAIVARMTATDPAWYRPLRRRKHAQEVERLEDNINRAVRHLELVCLGDAAPSRRARKEAKTEAQKDGEPRLRR